jgi:hypothetical protein
MGTTCNREDIRTLEHFCKYSYGQEFHLSTNHSALTWLMSCNSWSQQPHGLRQELCSLARTLGSWIWIPPKAWMFGVYAFILCLCCPAFRERPCDRLITHPKSPTICEKWLWNRIRGQRPEWAGRGTEKKMSCKNLEEQTACQIQCLQE